MSRLNTSRRSVLAALATSGLLSGASSAGAAASEQGDQPAATIETSSQQTGQPQIIGVEFIHRETDKRWLFESPATVDTDRLPEGGYDVIEVIEEDGRVTQQTTSYHVSDAIETRVEDGQEIRLRAVTDGYDDVVPTDGKLEVWVGVVEVENGREVGVVSGVDLELRVVNPNRDVIATTQVTTDNDGNARAEFNFEGAQTGNYDIIAESSDGDQADEFFRVGRYTDLPFHWTGMTPDEETTLGVYSAEGTEPEAGVTRTIEVDTPDGTEEYDVEIGPGGIGLLQYTPSTAGWHRFSSPTSPAYGASIGCGELKALNPYFGIRNQYAGETVVWGAYVIEDKLPVTGLDVEVTLRNENDGTVVDQLTATTNDFGQFVVEFEAPDDVSTRYSIGLTAADGRSIHLFGDRIYFEEPTDGPTPSPIELDVSLEDFRVGTDTDVPVNISLTDSDTPIENATVSLLFGYSYRQVPAGEAVVETDANGQATYNFTIPANAPDGERLYVMAAVEINGETYTDTTSASIEQYQFEYETFGLERGTTNTIDVEVFDQVTEEPISDIDIAMFGNRYNANTETFDVDYTTTDGNGTGTIDLDIPGDVTREVMVNEVHRYRSTSSSSGSIIESFDITSSISPETPAPGDTITASYTTDHTSPVSALVVFPNRENGRVTILPEDTEKEFTVPADASPGEYLRLNFLLLGSDGEAANARGYVQVAEELTASFEYSPADPSVGEDITFTDTSSAGPDGTITDREWDLTGDGTVDETGESVMYSYGETAEYEVSLAVTDDLGNTDTTTQTVVVSSDGNIPPIQGDNPPRDLNDDGLYRDINGDGEFDIFDIQALYNNLDSDPIQNNPAAFNFSGEENPDEVTIFDVQALFTDLD